MSDFWAAKLAGRTPADTAPAYVAPVAGIPWWQQPTYQSAALPAHPAPPLPSPHDLHPLTAMKLPSKAMSARQNTECPNGCQDGNYMRATPNSSARCFSCGYMENGRHQHQLAGMHVTQDTRTSPAKAALGQSRSLGFRPDVIVGHGL